MGRDRSRLRSRAVISTPTLLPAVGVSPQVVYGTSILVAGYTGNCCRVVRASDSAQQDIGFVNGRINMAQAITFAGGSELTVTTWYDQSGNGNNATNAVVANQPRLRPQNAWNGVNCITFDGRRPTTSVLKSLTLPAGVTINRQSHTTFEVASAASSYNANAHYEIGDATTRQLLCTSSGFAGLALSLGSGASPNRRDNGRAPRLNPSVNATRGSASASRVSADTTTTDFAANTAGTSSGGLLGGSVIGSSFNGTLEMMAFVHYAGVLTDTEYSNVQNSLQAAYAVSYNQTRIVAFVGDSITEGTSSTNLFNMPRQVVQQLNKDVHAYNMGVHGTTAATIDTNKVGLFDNIVRGAEPKVCLIGLGTNDVSGGALASAIWTNDLLPIIQYAKNTRGYSVVVGTLIPRAGFTAPQETERLALNTLITSNAIAEGYSVCDYTTSPVFDSQADASNTTYYDPDGIHPNSTGYGVMAGIAAPIINGLI
jgi:lysophospholipase L1-like esterase